MLPTNTPPEILFKSVDKRFDPRDCGTIRIGSLKYYRSHYDESVRDTEEGCVSVRLSKDAPVTLPDALANPLFFNGMTKDTRTRGGHSKFVVSSEKMVLTKGHGEWTISGEADFTFDSQNTLIFCMTAPLRKYKDTFKGDRIHWRVESEDLNEFSFILTMLVKSHLSPASLFPYLRNPTMGDIFIETEMGRVVYTDRHPALSPTPSGYFAALTFANAPFVKPSGPPKHFEREEEFRFCFHCAANKAGAKTTPFIPEHLDVPFAPLSHIIKF
ncbi:MAG: hypothetical protein ACX93U_13240 [Salipiger thiooxidans]|uniref:hypothetical protein n=1 Tax=Salipiger thiooxidans TaxID=282683 RepID=UPI001CF9FDAF|nr:hypothetical protein [Salipiger thiooxidans]